MKGILEKTSRGWIVKEIIGEGHEAKLIKTYPVHPSNVDSMEPCVLGEYGEVEFYFFNEYIDKHTNQIQTYVKIVTPTNKEIEFIKSDDNTEEQIFFDMELSDLEIEKAANEYRSELSVIFFKAGAKWYRDQLREKLNKSNERGNRR